METLVGFAVGYYVGTREGRAGMAKLISSWKAIRKQADLKTVVGGAIELLTPVVKEMAQVTSGRA